ncbi:matrixin family metalloprotease [Lactobacillus sp. A27]|uniref:matrixin family metalloprotease n=1 Tax=Lactobacillus sp. A27 TaxID=2796363 RepID=UPI00191D9249|nr:matrixin family metalloprotease [Lactobacillus sp. A27]MBL1060823.1 matrixin family metalloprotease [Lactobacillus sp. A27]
MKKIKIFLNIATVIVILIGLFSLNSIHRQNMQSVDAHGEDISRVGYKATTDQVSDLKEYGTLRYNETVLPKHDSYNVYVNGNREFNRKVRDALSEWFYKHYHIVNNPNKAQIIIDEKEYNRENAGVEWTKVASDGCIATQARINIYAQSIKDDDSNMVRVIEHEIGHALGLDHTKDKGSVMYPNDEYYDKADITLKNFSQASKNFANVAYAQ